MLFDTRTGKLFLIGAFFSWLVLAYWAVSAQAEESAPLRLHENVSQNIVDRPFTIKSAVELAQLNYPAILKGHAQVNAAKKKCHCTETE